MKKFLVLEDHHMIRIKDIDEIVFRHLEYEIAIYREGFDELLILCENEQYFRTLKEDILDQLKGGDE